MLPIEAPEYAGQRNRLHGIIKGTEFVHLEEPDASKRCGRTYHTKPGNPMIEGVLTTDLHYLARIKLSDLL